AKRHSPAPVRPGADAAARPLAPLQSPEPDEAAIKSGSDAAATSPVPSESTGRAKTEPAAKDLVREIERRLAAPSVPQTADTSRQRERRGALLVMTGFSAFLAGAGLVGLLWFLSAPVPPPPVPATAMTLPSPYEALNSLTDKSPGGTRVKVDEGGQ